MPAMQTIVNPSPLSPVGWRAPNRLPWATAAAGVVLFAAAGLKWRDLPTVVFARDGFFHVPWFVFTQIQLETALALWLVSGLLPLWSRRAAIAAFTLFAIVTACKALTGADSCGCFGQLKVNPYLTLALDTAILTALVWTRRKNPLTADYTDFTDQFPVLSVPSAPSVVKTLRSAHWRLGFLIAGVATVGVLTFLRMPTLVASPAQGGITFASGLAILEPEEWPGRPLPIMEFLEDTKSAIRNPQSEIAAGNWKSALGNGPWTLIIYSNDCDHCRQRIPSLLQQASSSNLSPSRPLSLSPSAWAFIELPPYAQPGQELVPPAPGRLRLRLSAAHEWFAQTPVVVHLENGIVNDAKQGTEVVLPKDPS